MNKSLTTHDKHTNEELIKMIQNGEDKFNEFVKQNYGLISQLAFHYSSCSLLEYDDLLNCFTYVAWKCIKSFDCNLYNNFSTMFYQSCFNEVLNLIRGKEYRIMKKSFSLHNKTQTLNDEEMEYIDLIETNHSFVTYEGFLREYCTSILKPRMDKFQMEVAIYYLFNESTINETAQYFNISVNQVARYQEKAKKILRMFLTRHWI